ncbi:MAG: carbon-nitrogen hydrolase family protein [Deltaproteobacteria bacterium]|nr:carbon-nitrogen hydrolase family protein [Deltaproteobacteria bacterium]MBW2067896.1 carbon-nitrogen hydrolase family protein [Deltaproteobacteria bacterium]
MQEKLIVGLAQIKGSNSVAQNLEKVDKFTRLASEEGIQFLVFPEMLMALPSSAHPPGYIARQHGKIFEESAAEIAAKHKIYLAITCWEESDEPDKAYNKAIVFDSDGSIVATYRKAHLFDALDIQESKFTKPGNQLSEPFPLHGFSVGITICYDLRFPELYRHLATKGTDLILVLAAWYQGTAKEDHWLTLLKARAIENTCYVAGCNMVGKTFCGRSAIFDPFGICLGDAGEEEKLINAEITLNRLKQVRSKLPALNHRRPELFSNVHSPKKGSTP